MAFKVVLLGLKIPLPLVLHMAPDAPLTLPARVIIALLAHTVEFNPALAETELVMLITISSEVEEHEPLEMVHLSVTLEPASKPVTCDVGELGETTVAVPVITLQVPVPTAGIFPASVLDVILQLF